MKAMKGHEEPTKQTITKQKNGFSVSRFWSIPFSLFYTDFYFYYFTLNLFLFFLQNSLFSPIWSAVCVCVSMCLRMFCFCFYFIQIVFSFFFFAQNGIVELLLFECCVCLLCTPSLSIWFDYKHLEIVMCTLYFSFLSIVLFLFLLIDFISKQPMCTVYHLILFFF